MRLILTGSIAVFLLAVLVSACSTVCPDECWVNSSGGFGGSGTIPIGAGVGAVGSGDFADPPRGPLANGEAPDNPCVTPETPPPQSSCEMPTPAAERATSWICSEACSAKCAPHIRLTFANFSPSDFPFVTIIQDDGTDKGGGWQVASVNLEFIDASASGAVKRKWYCPFKIEMPLRTKVMGKVSASRAAKLSVEVTNGVADDMDWDDPAGIFCEHYIISARAAFKDKYKNLGALVTK